MGFCDYDCEFFFMCLSLAVPPDFIFGVLVYVCPVSNTMYACVRACARVCVCVRGYSVRVCLDGPPVLATRMDLDSLHV